MHFFSADYIFPVSSPPIHNGLIVTDDAGVILDLLPQHHENRISEESEVQRFSGIICPGFINAHCHLELSHLKGKISKGTSLPGFIRQIVRQRTETPELIAKAIASAETEMRSNGIVGVGDICNTTDSIPRKKKNNLRYYNFIELFDISPGMADETFDEGLALKRKFDDAGLPSSLIPHSPYSVTQKLLQRINDFAYTHDGLLSLHNQETKSEDELFKNKSGALFDTLSSMNDSYHQWKPTGFSSLASTLVHLPRCNKILLVHNTYTTLEDINWAHLYSPVIYWCFCPNANLYIENRLPDMPVFMNGGCRIMLGTDSYASNTSLSILEELKTINRQFPKIKFEEMLRWATLNGAEFFGWHKEFGSLEKGKKPGINLITDVNTENQSLSNSSEVKPLFISATTSV